MLVADASVLVKVLTEEPKSEIAMALLTEAGIVIAPDIVTVEVASALSKKVRYYGLSRANALASFAALPAFLTETCPIEDLIGSAFDLSIHLQHALQDCMYLALAIDRDCRVATSDLKFARRVEAAGMQDKLVIIAS